MTVTVSKPALNLREELSALKKPSGIKGEELLRSNTVADVYTSVNPVMFRNRVINGDFRVDQRRNGSSLTGVTGGQDAWLSDRFRIGGSAMPTARMTWQQVADAPVGSGFKYSGKITVTAAEIATNQTQVLSHIIEGTNTADFEWGTAAAKPASLSFWVKASITGKYSVAIRSDNGNATFVATYQITQPNVWEYKAIQIPAPVNYGTWGWTNSLGIRLDWDLGSGTNGSTSSSGNVTATPNIWQYYDAFRTADTVRLIEFSNATWQITGVQLEKSSVATPFEFRPYATELALCQRYFEKIYYRGSAYGNGSNSIPFTIPLKVSKRAAPSTSVGADPEGWIVNYPSPSATAYDTDSVVVNPGSVPTTGLSRFGGILSISSEM